MVFIVSLMPTLNLMAQKLSDISISSGVSEFSSGSQIGGEDIFCKHGFFVLGEYKFFKSKRYFWTIGLGYSSSAIGAGAEFRNIEDGSTVFIKSSRIVSQYLQFPVSVNYDFTQLLLKPKLELSLAYLQRLKTIEGKAFLGGFELPTAVGHLYNNQLFRFHVGIGFPFKILNSFVLQPEFIYGRDLTPSISDDQSSSRTITDIYFSSYSLSIKVYVN